MREQGELLNVVTPLRMSSTVLSPLRNLLGHFSPPRGRSGSMICVVPEQVELAICRLASNCIAPSKLPRYRTSTLMVLVWVGATCTAFPGR